MIFERIYVARTQCNLGEIEGNDVGFEVGKVYLCNRVKTTWNIVDDELTKFYTKEAFIFL